MLVKGDFPKKALFYPQKRNVTLVGQNGKKLKHLSTKNRLNGEKSP